MTERGWCDGVVCQDDALKTLDGIMKIDSPGRFVLLHGPEGVGKRTVAEKMMSWALCSRLSENAPCGQCLGCRNFADHPDAVHLTPEKSGGKIKVADVREAAAKAFYPPVSARNRAWLINPAEALTPSSANAMLRLLEELPSKLWVVAITHNPGAVPITVRSRAIKVPFRTLDSAGLESILGESGPAANAGTMIRASLLSNPDFQRQVETWQRLIATRRYDPDAAVKFARGAKSGLSLREFMIALLALSDVASVAASLPAAYNGESQQPVAALVAALDERDVLLTAVTDLDRNVNPSFVCEDTVRRIRGIRRSLSS